MDSRHQVTRRAAMLTGLGVGVLFLPGCSSGETPLEVLSNRLSKEAASVEPNSFVKTYRIDPSGLNGAFKTFQACFAAVEADRLKRLGPQNPLRQSNPWDWRQVLVATGHYSESLTNLPSHLSIVGQGSGPDDVRLSAAKNGPMFTTTGRTIHIKNVTIEAPSTMSDVSILDDGVSDDPGLGVRQRRTITMQDVVLRATASRAATKISLGPGMLAAFVGCRFEGTDRASALELVTGDHGGDTPGTVIFHGCERPSVTHSGAPTAVSVEDAGGARKDRVIWSDKQAQKARSHGSIAVKAKASGSHVGTQFLTAPSADLKIFDIPAAQLIKADVKDVQLPKNGISQNEARFFGDEPQRGVATIGSSDTSGETITIQPGEFYWVALDLNGQAVCTVEVGFDTPAKGAFLAGVTGPQLQVNRPDLALAVVAGSSPDVAYAGLGPAWYFPGAGPLWAAVGAYGGAVTVPALRSTTQRALKISGAKESAKILPDASKATQIPAGSLVPALIVSSALPPSMA